MNVIFFDDGDDSEAASVVDALTNPMFMDDGSSDFFCGRLRTLTRVVVLPLGMAYVMTSRMMRGTFAMMCNFVSKLSSCTAVSIVFTFLP